MRRALDYGHLPPASLPLGFLLAAPWFGVAAGILAALRGPGMFASRWDGATLAATHLLTLGFLALAMAGSLVQMLPVVAGLPLRTPRAAAWSRPLLGGGAVLLASAFLTGRALMFAIAAPLLAGAFALLFCCVLATLWQRGALVPAVAHIAHAMRGAAAALVAALAAGLPLAAWLAGDPLPAVLRVPALIDIHAALGLVGWVAVLVIGVAFQVLPMFQTTDPFPRAARGLPAWLAAALLAWAAGRWVDAGWRHAAAAAGALALAGWAGLALSLLARRRRGKRGPTAAYWFLSLVSLLGAAGLFAWPGADGTRALAAGVLFVAGFAMSVVTGMLYKIVPFLLWYHAQQAATPGARVPKMGELVADRQVRAQFRWHAAAVAASVGACWMAPLGRAAGVLLAGACLRLGLDLARAALSRRRPATPPHPVSPPRDH